MNADDPILLERRCDQRIPALGLVCVLEAGHEGDHMAEADPAMLGEQVSRMALMIDLQRRALEAGGEYVRVLERDSRRSAVLIAVLLVVDVLLLGLRLAGA